MTYFAIDKITNIAESVKTPQGVKSNGYIVIELACPTAVWDGNVKSWHETRLDAEIAREDLQGLDDDDECWCKVCEDQRHDRGYYNGDE